MGNCPGGELSGYAHYGNRELKSVVRTNLLHVEITAIIENDIWFIIRCDEIRLPFDFSQDITLI